MKNLEKSIHNNKGLTLVEVLASIVILSIVLLFFLLIFLQSIKATNTSEEIIDATYVAQFEMENMYELSREGKNPDKPDYDSIKQEENVEVFKRELIDNFHVEITLEKPDPDSSMTKVIVQVYENESSAEPKAQMENLFEWRSEENE